MKSGIYMIKNTKNNKCYIGQSKNVYKRMKEHKQTMKYKRENKKFNKDLEKYNIKDFKFEILELCDIKKLNKREEYYSNLYNSIANGYNSNVCGKSKIQIENEKNITTIYIDKSLHKKVQILAITLNESVSELVEKLLKEEVEKWEKGE